MSCFCFVYYDVLVDLCFGKEKVIGLRVGRCIKKKKTLR